MNGNLAYKEEPLEERIGGRFVMMAPAVVNHNRIARNISSIFDLYLRGKPCEFFPDGTGLYLTDEEEYIPDGMVVCDSDKVKPDGVHGTPDLVVEILSRSTAKYDRGHKREAYEKYGVKEYWIVSPGDLSVEQYVLENNALVLRDIYHKYPHYALAHMRKEERAALVTEFRCSLFDDLSIRLDDIFNRVVISYNESV